MCPDVAQLVHVFDDEHHSYGIKCNTTKWKRHSHTEQTHVDGYWRFCVVWWLRRSESKNNFSKWKTLAAPCSAWWWRQRRDLLQTVVWRHTCISCAMCLRACVCVCVPIPHFWILQSFSLSPSPPTLNRSPRALRVSGCIRTQSVGQLWFHCDSLSLPTSTIGINFKFDLGHVSSLSDVRLSRLLVLPEAHTHMQVWGRILHSNGN